MSSASSKIRLDQLLIYRGLVETRSRARDAIVRGTVRVDGEVILKPGLNVWADSKLDLDDPAAGYVSRAALKLIAGLDHFGLDPTNRTVMDIGASTGGFTQVVLERGASHVLAVDVGHDQLHSRLRDDTRVTNLEGLNARALTQDDIARPYQAIVSDVSFISLRLALPPALELADAGSFALLLVKPQFEASPADIGKGGILKDPALGIRISQAMDAWLGEQSGWRSLGTIASPISGGDGNQEYLLGGLKDESTAK